MLGSLTQTDWRSGLLPPRHSSVFSASGELLIGSEAEYSSASHLYWGDVALDSRADARYLGKNPLKEGKVRSIWSGSRYSLGPHRLCPVTAMIKFINCRGDSPGYFFIDGEKNPITKPRFIAQLRGYMKAAGLPSNQFAGHSFCIGAATTAAKASMEDSMIQTLGRCIVRHSFVISARLMTASQHCLCH